MEDSVGAVFLLASVIAFVGGLIGLLKPSFIRLQTRAQAAFLISLMILLVGTTMFLLPGNKLNGIERAQTRNAGLALVVIWITLVGVTVFIRKFLQAQRAAPGRGIALVQVVDADDKTAPKIGFMRAVASSLNPDLRRQIVDTLKERGALNGVVSSSVAREFNISEKLTATLITNARRETLEAYLLDVWSKRSLDQNVAQANAEALGLPNSEFDKIWSVFSKREANMLVDRLLADGQITPNEEVELDLARAILSADLSKRVDELSEAKEMWRVCNAPLEPVDAPIMLKRGEFCLGHRLAEATEVRTRTRSISYGGPSARIRIAKGISYNIGSRRISSHKEEYEHSFGNGSLTITSSRLIWSGDNRTLSIPYNKIINVEAYSDGVTIYKDTGKPINFGYVQVSRSFSALILRVAEECR